MGNCIFIFGRGKVISVGYVILGKSSYKLDAIEEEIISSEGLWFSREEKRSIWGGFYYWFGFLYGGVAVV